MEMSTTVTKCLSEEIQSNVVGGDYSILFEDHPTRPMASTKVTSPYDDVLHHGDKVAQGQFALTSILTGKLGLRQRIETLAKKEKLEGVALELVKLERAVQAIHGNLIYLRSKEADMTDVSEWTNFKITWLSLMSLAVCIIISIVQLWHLKQFFRKKKVI